MLAFLTRWPPHILTSTDAFSFKHGTCLKCFANFLTYVYYYCILHGVWSSTLKFCAFGNVMLFSKAKIASKILDRQHVNTSVERWWYCLTQGLVRIGRCFYRMHRRPCYKLSFSTCCSVTYAVWLAIQLNI